MDRTIALLESRECKRLACGHRADKGAEADDRDIASSGFFSRYVARKQQDAKGASTNDAILKELTTELRAVGIAHEEELRILGIQNVVLI